MAEFPAVRSVYEMNRPAFAWNVCAAVMLGFVPAFGADEFQVLSDDFGTTKKLAGVHHAVTSNPNGTAINFWTTESEGGTATEVGLSNPHMAGADAYGNVFIADKAGHAILRISPDGLIHTFAGTHVAGFNGDGPAPAAALQINNPNGLFVLPQGVVYLLDPGNHRIRRVDTNGVMRTVVNDPEPRWAPSGRALWVSSDEQLIYYSHEFLPQVVNGVTNAFSDGAAIKQWTPQQGIQTVCSRAVGFQNPGNLDVNPVNGKLYVTDRAEEDTTNLAAGLFRIEGPDRRTRITGDVTQSPAADGQPALESYIAQPRGIAFRPDGSYLLCGHKDGSVWFVDTQGILHEYLHGSGKKDGYSVDDGLHPPLLDSTYFAQPRAVTLAPNGNLIVVCNDSGYVFQVAAAHPDLPRGLRLERSGIDSVHLRWTGTPRRGFRVERKNNLSAGGWTPIGATGAGPTGSAEFIDPVSASEPHGFYRVLPAL